MKILIRFWNRDGEPMTCCRYDPPDMYSYAFKISPFKVRKFVKMYKVIKWRVVWSNRITCFLGFLGSQNDYLFPVADQRPEDCPFPKPHLWKTRMGFKTAFNVTKAIYGKI